MSSIATMMSNARAAKGTERAPTAEEQVPTTEQKNCIPVEPATAKDTAPNADGLDIPDFLRRTK
jgi:hypothetical protein